MSSISMNLIYSQSSMEFRDDNMYSRMLLSSLDYEYKITNNFFAKARLKYSNWNAELSEEQNEVLNPEIYFNYITKGNLITAGADFKNAKFTRTAVQEQAQSIFGVYVQDEVELDRFSFLAALRFDKVKNISSVFTPKIAVMYQASNNLRLRASFGRGFHAPTVQ